MNTLYSAGGFAGGLAGVHERPFYQAPQGQQALPQVQF